MLRFGKPIHIGEMISAKLEEMHLRPAELARRLNYSLPGTMNILKRKSVQVVLLKKISNALGHNFFEEFVTMPKVPDVSELDNEIAALKDDLIERDRVIEKQKMELEYLKKIVALYEKGD